MADGRSSRHRLELQHGGIATSGDTRRYLLKDSVRYSHILDPTTGWPMQGAPRSVTVAASTCTEAGALHEHMEGVADAFTQDPIFLRTCQTLH